MRNHHTRFSLGLFFLLHFFAASGVSSQEPPFRQASRQRRGEVDALLQGSERLDFHEVGFEIKQDGNTLSGHFKGPNQSGGIEGTINLHLILVRTKTRIVLTFRGRVDGNTINGTFHDRGGQGEFTGQRSD